MRCSYTTIAIYPIQQPSKLTRMRLTCSPLVLVRSRQLLKKQHFQPDIIDASSLMVMSSISLCKRLLHCFLSTMALNKLIRSSVEADVSRPPPIDRPHTHQPKP